jgi:hypothetical protein
MEPRGSNHFGFASALLAIGVSCELSSMLLVLCNAGIDAALAHALTIACAIIASSTIVRESRPLLDQRAQTIAWASVGVIVACVPLLGMIALATVIAPIWRSARASESDTWIELPMDRRARLGATSYASSGLSSTRGQAARPSAAARARAQARGSLAIVPIREILRGTGPAHERIQAVMALRRMPARDALPLLRSALTDPSEDVRLLAYAILERREKSLRASIERKLGALAEQNAGSNPHGASTGQQLGALRELAHDHWELVHGGFVEGELAQRTLELAAEHTSAALALLMSSDASATAGREGDLAVLLARIELRRDRTQEAARALELAGRAGVAESTLAPLLAELAFIERRFDRIPSLLAPAAGAQLDRPRLHAVIEHWRAPSPRSTS